MPEGRQDRMAGLALELVKRQVSVIVEQSSVAILATKAATQTIPIVFLQGIDPVDAGYVVSLNRPGGNITGVSLLAGTVTAKRFELLHELVPAASTVAFLVNPDAALSAEIQTNEARLAARALGLNLVVLNAASPAKIDAAFATMAERGVGGLILNDASMCRSRADQIAALAARHRLPAIYAHYEGVPAGGLMSYGADVNRRGARSGPMLGVFSTAKNLRNCRYT
jgi:putative ABC transport system substrate-binding protein